MLAPDWSTGPVICLKMQSIIYLVFLFCFYLEESCVMLLLKVAFSLTFFTPHLPALFLLQCFHVCIDQTTWTQLINTAHLPPNELRS